MMNKTDKDLERIKVALRKGAIQRNGKTALLLGIALSGAIVGTPWLIATLGGTSLYLYTFGKRKEKFSKGKDIDNTESNLR